MANIIQSFSIYGLFGTRDVHIPFNDSVKIMVGENGIGKTQILNIFYYFLIGDFEKLYEFSFDRIVLQLVNDKIEISKKVLNNVIGEKLARDPDFLFQIKEILGAIKFHELRLIIRKSLDIQDEYKAMKYIEKYIQLSFPEGIGISFDIIQILRKREYKRFNKVNDKDLKASNTFLLKAQKKLKKYFYKNSILYFPTFRRIEEDLHNLGYDEDRFHSKEDNRLIHFGMGDVKRRFRTVERKVDGLLKIGLSKISSEILSHLIKGFGNVNKDVLEQIDENDIDIILARVGNEIPEVDKIRIRKIVLEKKIDDKDASLLYFLQTLIQIYEKQRPLDEIIKRFQEVCNRYLVDKKVFYDESEIKISIQSDETNEALELSKLSSGEKQIISVFSKIYLAERDDRFLVLFDEPELSLSMFWQKQLLPDIMDSGKCDFLFAVTHSPFIFDNELDQYAIGLSEYIQPSTQNISV